MTNNSGSRLLTDNYFCTPSHFCNSQPDSATLLLSGTKWILQFANHTDRYWPHFSCLYIPVIHQCLHRQATITHHPSWQHTAVSTSVNWQPCLENYYYYYYYYYSFTALCLGLPGWASTRRNIHPLSLSWSSIIRYQLPPSTTINSILPVQFTFLTVFLHNLSPSLFGLPLGMAPSTSYSIHFFTHSVTVFFTQHMAKPTQPVLL